VYRAVKQTVILLLLASMAFFAACSKGGSGSASGVAATVNGKPIMLSEIDTIIHQKYQGQETQLSQLEMAQERLTVLDSLIQQEALYQRAEKEKLVPTEDEVTQRINQLKQQAAMTDEQYQRQLREQNKTEQSLRDDMRRDLAIQKLQEKWTSKSKVSDREVEDFYHNNPQQFVRQRGVGLAEIVVDPRDNGLQDDAKNEQEAQQKIKEIYTQLQNNDFAQVARARSEDQSNAQGGDIGFATEDDLRGEGFPQDLIGQLFGAKKVGDITDPVQFRGRWYIFKLTGKQLATENLTLDSQGVREQVTNILLDQRKKILTDALLRVAMADAKVVNNLANEMLNNPENYSGLRPAGTPAASPGASPASSTAAPQPSSANVQPGATLSPTARTTPSASPHAQASPRATTPAPSAANTSQPTRPATPRPAGQASPR